MILSVRSHQDLGKLRHLENKKNILARFILNGCTWCEKSQPEWDSLCSQAKNRLSPDTAIAEIESNFLENFNTTTNTPVQVRGFPTILYIRGNQVIPQEARDARSLIKVIRLNKSRRNLKKKLKTKRSIKPKTF